MSQGLALNAVTKRFGGHAALDRVSFHARSGEVHALLGENGAGKSTLMNVACGLYAPDEGSIDIDGQPVQLDNSAEAAKLGIGMVHQHFKLVPAFSVLENIQLFNPDKPAGAIAEQAEKLSQELGFALDLAANAGTLPISEQQRLEILKVLIAGARTIILDEPTAVLSPEEATSLMDLIGGLARKGAAVILVTHKLREALHHSDRITVLRQGQKIAEALPSSMGPEELTNLIVGESVVELPERSEHVGAPMIWLRDVQAAAGRVGQKGLTGMSFTVHCGEIYGIAGVAGNGQSELADVITGMAHPTGGSIWIDGENITQSEPAVRRRAGLAAIPVDRYQHGLAGSASVAENYAVHGVLAGRYGGWLRLKRGAIRNRTSDAAKAFDVQGIRSTSQRAALLSGGNAQKLVIAREFETQPRVVYADSPSRGLDVRAAAAVHDRLKAARKSGAGVILSSEDLDELLLLSDRIGVLREGRIVAEFDVPVQRSEIGHAMVSHDHH